METGRQRRADGAPAPDAARENEAARRHIRQLIASLLPESAEKRPNKRGQETREKLIAAAADCFSDYGYNRTRISDIASRAGTAQGNFYRHFSSLDEIFLAALQPALEELASTSAPSHPNEGGLQHLINQNITYLQVYSRNRHLLRVMREAAASEHEGFASLWLQLRAGFVHRTRRWLERLHERGKIGSADFGLLAEALGSLTEQMAYVHVGLPPVAPRPERIKELATVIGEVWYRALPPVDEKTPDPAP
ncbi:TetR family transcriptional regulator [Actinomadura hallensis]|uniref:TetR family transcriptional regulator n=1 Tax=Actinomadura hallensis TaxID=337895 RepID=A0A543I926_9ACTN|nr:TetR/AcrR family transcriptional regulator [Actinomadura hallensis]TQM67092.1 TetR family transcriptional regulator [Actinomadura hallensis]HLV75377.1 TetR/AcrR family transcriptional regulator [Vulgatibacteraceae bacterium]